MTKAKILIKSEIIPDKIISRLERPNHFTGLKDRYLINDILFPKLWEEMFTAHHNSNNYCS